MNEILLTDFIGRVFIPELSTLKIPALQLNRSSPSPQKKHYHQRRTENRSLTQLITGR